MENNQELFRQAILEAKEVREIALAAARTTLAEHFEPYIKEEMAKTLSEEGLEESEAGEERISKKDTAYKYQAKDHVKEMHGMHNDDSAEHQHLSADVEESYLDEILSELDALSEKMEEEGADEDGPMEEGHTPEDGYTGKLKAKGSENGSYSEKAKTTKGDVNGSYTEKLKDHIHEGEEGEDEGGMADDDTQSIDGSDEQEVVDITVGELKDIIRDVFMQLQGGAGEEEPETFDADTDLSADLGGEEGEEEEGGEISLEEILAELENEEKMEEGSSDAQEIPAGVRGSKYKMTNVSNVQARESALKEDLNEAVKTIKVLKTELNEMNLFNAKMLYVNKIFKAKNLNETQKTKVINAFDRATSVKEVENTYKTLLESVGEAPKKTSIKESVGFASKPIGNAPARPIVEADAFVTRWQQLAGIK
jgi:hypothetical protein